MLGHQQHGRAAAHQEHLRVDGAAGQPASHDHAQSGPDHAGHDRHAGRYVPSRRTRLHLFAPLSTRVLNPLTRLVAGRLPGLGVLTHTGRRTRRRYRTPLLVLRDGDDYVVALWYGSDVHWVKNVLVSSGCELRTRGRNVRLAEPRLSADPARRILPLPLRWAGSVVGLTEFLRLRAVGR